MTNTEAESKTSTPQPSSTLPLLIAALSMMGPFSIDTYLPSFREMEESLHATPLQVQQSLTAFLVPFAFMSLWHGALSDALGRRRVVIVALCILSATSIGCALAPSIEVLWFFRAMQGLSAGVFVVGRAVVRDVYEGATAHRVMSHVSVIFAIAPAIAPILGGQLHEWFGWRSVFVFLACFAAAIATWSACCLPETLPISKRQPLHPAHLLRSYGQALTHGRFVAAAFACGLSFAGIFIYVAGAPVLLLRHLHIAETQFFWLFGPTTAGMMTGSALSGYFAGKIDSTRAIRWAYILMAAAAGANVAFHLMHEAALPWSVIPLFFYAAGMTFSLPTLTLIGLDIFPARRGLASSCQSFILTSTNALVAGVLVPIVSASPLAFSIGTATLMVLSLVCAVIVARSRVQAVP